MRKSMALALSLLGLFVALYLLYTYTSSSRPMVCIGGGCDAVRASAYSNPWGVPMPVFGVFGYVLAIIALVSESLFSGRFAKLARFAFLGMSGFGFLLSLYLDYLQAFKIHAYCAWCLTSGGVMTVLFVLAIVGAVRPSPEPDLAARLAQVRMFFAIAVACLALGAPTFYVLARHGEVAAMTPQAMPADMAVRLTRPGSHEAGSPRAPLTVVEFGDFECPVCARADVAAREIRTRYAGQVRFVFRQFPLEQIHPFAEQAAEASECAADQGKFWEALEKIYSRQEDLGVKGLKRDAAELGLDQTRFNDCLSSGSMEQRVRRDMEDGRALGVRATPTFFIGSKMVEGALTAAQLEQLIFEQLPGLSASAPGSARQVESPTAAAQKKPAATPPVAAKPEPGASRPATAPGGFLPGLSGGSPGGLIGGTSSAGATCSEADALKKQPTQIKTEELKQVLAANPGVLFVDVRPASEFATGRIPGAINLPSDDIERRWGALPKDRTIVLYESGRSSGDICAAGRSVGRALLAHGFDFARVKVYQEGLAGWETSGLGNK